MTMRHGQLRSAQVPLDVKGQVVRPGERSTADVAFERLDPSVFPLRGCSDISLPVILQVTFTLERYKLHRTRG